jgi:16S rRNA (guanine(527)-N(7))-methyltransferase RsmG
MTPPRQTKRPGERRPDGGWTGARDKRGSGRAGAAKPASSRARADSKPAGGREGSREQSPRGGATQRARPAPVPDPEKLVARQPWASLRNMLEGAPAGVEPSLALLKRYAFELLTWNRGVSNLISRHDEMRLVDRHVAESLFPAGILRASGCERFVDLGSGAGLPAIPLAIAGVGTQWTLVESRRNKTLFMRKALQECGLKNIVVVCSRLETLIEEEAAQHLCDGFTSRATMTVGPTLEMAGRLVKPGGRAFLWKGSSFETELKAADPAWERDWAFEAAHPIVSGPNVLAVFLRQ